MNMKITLVFTIFALITTTSLAQKPPVYSTSAGAIKGYDPVAYFEEGKPVKGSDEITYEWNGATWHFSTSEHKNAFEENPEKYAPQFGGYCAYAVSKGSTAKIEPDAWKIVDGKLYLNYDQGIKKRWEADQANYIEKANANWPEVLK